MKCKTFLVSNENIYVLFCEVIFMCIILLFEIIYIKKYIKKNAKICNGKA